MPAAELLGLFCSVLHGIEGGVKQQLNFPGRKDLQRMIRVVEKMWVEIFFFPLLDFGADLPFLRVLEGLRGFLMV